MSTPTLGDFGTEKTPSITVERNMVKAKYVSWKVLHGKIPSLNGRTLIIGLSEDNIKTAFIGKQSSFRQCTGDTNYFVVDLITRSCIHYVRNGDNLVLATDQSIESETIVAFYENNGITEKPIPKYRQTTAGVRQTSGYGIHNALMGTLTGPQEFAELRHIIRNQLPDDEALCAPR